MRRKGLFPRNVVIAKKRERRREALGSKEGGKRKWQMKGGVFLEGERQRITGTRW